MSASAISLELFTQPNINTGIGMENRSVNHDETEAEEFEIISDEYASSVEEMEHGYIIL